MEGRIIDILMILYENNDFVLQEKLCETLRIKPRTLREDLKNYRKIIEEQYGIIIENKNNLGYKLNIINEDKFQLFKDKILKGNSNVNSIPKLQNERVNYIIRFFLEGGGYVKSDDIAEKLYISKSTLAHDLKLVKKKMAKYNLKFESKSGYGMKILGNEIDIRKCMSDFYFYSKNDFKMFNLPYEKDVNEILLKIIKKNNFKMSDIGYKSLVIHIGIALSRVKFNRQINDDKEYNFDDKKEFAIANEIAEEIYLKTLLRLSLQEINYITIHLLGNKIFDKTDNEIIEPDVINTVNMVLKEIKYIYKINLSGDIELFTMLAIHIQPMLTRMKFNLKIYNPLLSRVKEEMPLAFEIALFSGDLIGKKYKKRVDVNEIGYLAIHFQLAIDRMVKHEKKNILVVCASGAGTSMMLLNKIHAKFSLMINKIETAKAYELDSMDLNKFDLILTTIPLSIKSDTKILQITYLFDDNDEKCVENVLMKNDDEINFIKSCFVRELFYINKEFEDKNHVIKFLCDKLSEYTEIPDNFEQKVFEREKLASTDLGRRIAIVHPSILMLDRTIVAICHLKKPIFWGNQDVDFVFLLGAEKKGEAVYKLFEKVLFSIINNAEIIRKLYENPSYDFFMQELISVCKKQKTSCGSIFE